MRIIAGKLGGRLFNAPKGHRTHPMSDKARGALFNSLGRYMEGTRVLDAFAGTGALAFEAISRGAANVVAIDTDRNAFQAMKESVRTLEISAVCKIVKANASGWSDNNPSETFDIVFAAPPYDNLQPGVVQKLVRHTKKDSLFILDWPGKLDLPELAGLQLENSKQYGDAQLAFFRADGSF